MKISIVTITGRDGHGDLCIVPFDCVAWISRFDRNDEDDIFGTLDGDVYTCNGGWKQGVEIHEFGGEGDEDQDA